MELPVISSWTAADTPLLGSSTWPHRSQRGSLIRVLFDADEPLGPHLEGRQRRARFKGPTISTSQLVRFDMSPRNPFADFLVERRDSNL